MSAENISSRYEYIERLIDQINSISMAHGKLQPVFRQRSVPLLKFTCYEAGFLKTISWLYMLYYESGRADINFLLEKFQRWDMDIEGRFVQHYKLIHGLRTNLQHSVNLDEPRNQTRKAITDEWFIKQVRDVYPKTSTQWKKCLVFILTDACSFFTCIASVVESILENESVEELMRSWNQYASHFHEPNEYDSIIYNVAYEIGIQIDVVRHRKKYYETWSKKISVLPTGYDFQTEARKLVQKTLLEDPQVPITSQDIIQALAIPPGPLVSHYLRLATQYYLDAPCAKDELLLRLKDNSSTSLTHIVGMR